MYHQYDDTIIHSSHHRSRLIAVWWVPWYPKPQGHGTIGTIPSTKGCRHRREPPLYLDKFGTFYIRVPKTVTLFSYHKATLVSNLLYFEYRFFSRVGLTRSIRAGKSSKPHCLADIFHLEGRKPFDSYNFRAPQNEK